MCQTRGMGRTISTGPSQGRHLSQESGYLAGWNPTADIKHHQSLVKWPNGEPVSMI